MSEPRQLVGLENVTSTGPGKEHKTRAHPQIGMWVEAGPNFTQGTDSLELRLEVSPNGEYYAPIDNASPVASDIMFVDGDELTEDGDSYVLYKSYHNAPIEYIRPNIVTHSGGFEVTVYMFLSGWTDRAVSFQELSYKSE